MTVSTPQMESMSDDELQALISQLSAEEPVQKNTNVPDFDAMSNDELISFVSKLEQEELPENRYTDLGEYYVDRIESGITATPSMVGAGIRTLLIDPFEKGGAETFEEFYHRFGENFMNYQHGYQDLFNLDVDKTGKLPPNDIHRYIGSGVEAFSDPYGLLVKTGGKITNVIARALGLQVVGSTAEVGGDVAAQIEESVTGEEEKGTWRTAGSLMSTIPAAMISKPIVSTTMKGGQSLYKKIREIKENPAAAQEAYATTYVKGILNRITEENPDIETILKDLNRIGVKWDSGNFPLIAAAGQSPTAHSQLVKLAKTNAKYRQGFMDELDRIKNLVEQNADRIFGERYAEFPWSDAAIKKGLQARQQRLIKARSHIDDRIQSLEDRVDPTMSDLDRGDAIEKLVAKRESLARAEVQPLYDDLMDRAKFMDIEVPADAVHNFYRIVKDKEIADLFGVGPIAERKIIKLLKPKKVKNEITGQIEEVPQPLTFDQVDSLKREINRVSRLDLDKAQRQRLNYVRDAFGFEQDGKRYGLRSYIPEEFDLELKSIDKLYFEKVGLPFNKEAIAQIGKKRYSSEVANIILKNREALDQYLNVAGKEGPQLARDAMIAKLHSKVIVDGSFNHKQLTREITKNKDIIDGIPGMRKEMDALLSDSDYLYKRMGTLDDAIKVEQKKVADHFLSTSGYAPDYNKLVKGVMNDRKSLNKFIGDIKKLDSSTQKAVLGSTRREFVEILKTQPDGAFNFLNNPKNAQLINKVMGKGYTQDFKEFAKVIDAMNGIDIKKLGATIEKAELDFVAQKLPGVSSKYLSSQIRDRISNIVMKITRITSKMLDFRNAKAMDRSVYELLTDRDGMQKVINAVAKMDFKIDNPAKINDIVGIIKETLPVYMYTGLKTSVSHEAEEIERKIQ